ncbi:BMP family lipoprotein [Clostridium folliculivorans]|uniref:BMP family ABC transporter substrate-binding protein n=1 Tax=Clostridium folliculivorans TaxID=2886038 RepID=A0A9W5Y5Y9_9CLOT|nr:BMP family ABC transporter substrate-binding protein [Clostridium folliculivorans]GKU27169.1 BMP family ABC transporter substrate-binding protein [Clostridium folliculivorans]GKU31786.1 BMP family ABC transporter substrate-binding protein [Clostridium folliculivorans]
MNKKKLMAAVASVAVVATLFAGCASKSNDKTTTDNKTSDKKVMVGLSTDEGGLNDKSFNQAADTGIKKAKDEFKFDYKAVESKSKDDYESNLDALVSEKANLVVGVGFQMSDAVKNAASKHTDVNFAIVDSAVDAANVRSILFKEQDGSFLMGVIAGKMAGTGKVGFIGGKDMELIQKFEAGFAAGVKAVNPTAAEDLIGRKTVQYVDSFTDAAKGKEAAKNLINAGCTVIYHAAGGAGEGMFQAVQEANKNGKKVWAIGVDMDQAVTLPQYADVILSSMIKKVDFATYQAAKDIVNGTFKAGTVELGLKEGGIDIAGTSSKNTPKDVLDLVAKYQAAVKDGKITVPTKPADVKAFAPAAVQ